MKRSRKPIITAILLVLSLTFLLAACGRSFDDRDHEYVSEDLSALSSDELEARADYGAFYRPEDGAVGKLMPYFEDGVYYIFYTSDNDTAIKLVETNDFASYTPRGEVFRTAGLAGESEISAGTIVECGDRYMFYSASAGGDGSTVRVAVAGDGLKSFTRKQDFILRASDFGLETGLYDPAVAYDGELDRFVAVVSTYYKRHAALALFYIDTKLSDDSAELSEIIYVDQSGASALLSPSIFKAGDKWFITYYAEDGSLAGHTDIALSGACGKMYYLSSDEMAGSYVPHEFALDSNVYRDGKVVSGSETVMIGRTLTRAANAGYEYGACGNMQAHVVSAAGDKLVLTYPSAYTERFCLDAPIVNSKNVTVDGSAAEPVEIAKELLEYRLTATLSFDSSVKETGFVFGMGGDAVKVAIDPVFGKLKASCDGKVSATGYINIRPDTDCAVDIFAEGSNYVMYIDGAAFTFRVRNAGNKKIGAYAVGGAVTLSGIKMLSPDGSVISDGIYPLAINGSREISVKADGCFVVGAATLYSEKEITVTLSCGESENSVTGSGFVDFYGYVDPDGENTFLTVTASAATTVYGNMRLYKSFARPAERETETRKMTGRGAGIDAKEDGVYEFNAIAKQEEASKGSLVVETGGKTVMSVALCDGFARAAGAVRVKKGDRITANVVFDGEVTDYTVRLALVKGESESVLPEGGCAGGKALPIGAVIEDGRADDVELAAVFGEQGKGGFVYCYGAAADELVPLPTYAEGAHSAGGSRMTKNTVTSDGALVGATYVVAEDGELTVTLGFTPEADKTFVLRLYKDRKSMVEKVVTRSTAKDIRLNITASKGDRITFAAQNAGAGSASAAFTFSVHPFVPLGADFRSEFYTDLADANRWVYGYSKNYDFNRDILDFRALDKYDDGWRSDNAAGVAVRDDCWVLNENFDGGCDVAVGYKIKEDVSLNLVIDFKGSNDRETRLCARVLVLDGAGNTKSVKYFDDGARAASWSITYSVSASEGDTVYLVLFREGGEGYYHGKLDIKITEI